jgi:hypothetical protein
MSEIRFLIDENVDDALRKGLHLHLAKPSRNWQLSGARQVLTSTPTR